MYTEHFGLREHPFRITPDPRFFYPNPGHQEAYAGLLYGITQRRGFVVLTGEVGTGKTMLLRRLMRELVDAVHFAFVYNTMWNFDEVLDAVCQDFDIHTAPGARQFDKIQALNHFLLTQFTQDKIAALLIDEAHNLSTEVIENLRLLSNLETGGEKLLQIVLVGQSELAEKLRQPLLRPLRDRIAIWGRLHRLKERDVGPFIQHRLQTAGCQRLDLFLPEAIERIAAYSQGSPRRINIICDNALLTAYGAYQGQIFADIIEEVAEDLGFTDERKPIKEQPEAAVAGGGAVSKATRPLVEDKRIFPVDVPAGSRHEEILQQNQNDEDELDVSSWSQRFNVARIVALGLLGLCLVSVFILRLSGKNPDVISNATTSLGSLFREWFFPLRPQVEAKAIERISEPEKHEGILADVPEGAEGNVKILPQLFPPPQNIEQLPSSQPTKKPADKEDGALIATPSTGFSGAKELARKPAQEQPQALALSDDRQRRGQFVSVPAGVTIFALVSRMYGEKNILALDMVKEYNPHVTNLDHVPVGERLWMPALTRDTLLRPQADGSYHLIVASFRKRKEADRWARRMLGERYPATILRQEISATVRLYRVEITGLHAESDIEQIWRALNNQEGKSSVRAVAQETLTVTNSVQ